VRLSTLKKIARIAPSFSTLGIPLKPIKSQIFKQREWKDFTHLNHIDKKKIKIEMPKKQFIIIS